MKSAVPLAPLAFIALAALPAQDARLASPGGQVAVTIAVDAAAQPTWTVRFRGAARLADCALGLHARGHGDLLAGAEITAQAERAHDAEVDLQFGRATKARDRYRELRVMLRGRAGLRVDVVLRCYDDAFAFRYEVPAQGDLRELRIEREASAFAIAGAPRAFVQVLPHHRSSHEVAIDEVEAAAIPSGKLLDVPLTLAWPSGGVASITEAALRRYPGMSLRREADGPLTVALQARADGTVATCPLPMRTPWRVVLFGDTPGALLESNALVLLNDPPAFDAAWVAPGGLTWPWWNGYLFEAQPTEPILSLATNRRYIDFCAAHGIAFHAVVADEKHTPWYHQTKVGLFPGPDTDATRARDDLPLAEIAAYAKEKGVRLWTWIHHGAIRGKVDAVFAALPKLGFAGVMVDFLDDDSQETIVFAEAVLAAAAKNHVLVHFHGMFKTTGLQRTFPNLMNHEGALNLEYLKWADTCTPAHTLKVAFTRLVAGPTDYHLGGFRAVRRADFAPRFTAPFVLGTRGHQLGLYVCFDNPAPMVADYPAAYRDQPGFDFVTSVPTWWDETRAVAADIGKLLVTARRRGEAWTLGGIAAGPARTVDVPLGFLGDGAFDLRLWRDGDDAEADPNELAVETRRVSRGDRLDVPFATDGGFAATLTPVR